MHHNLGAIAYIVIVIAFLLIFVWMAMYSCSSVDHSIGGLIPCSFNVAFFIQSLIRFVSCAHSYYYCYYLYFHVSGVPDIQAHHRGMV